MRLPKVRPRFVLYSPLAPSQLCERAGARLNRALRRRDADGTISAIIGADDEVVGLALADRIELTVGSEELRPWSPQLTVKLFEDGDGSRLEARFGPHPHLWTLYVALYAMMTFGAIAALMFGSAQLTMGVSPWGFALAPLALVGAMVVHAASWIGQKLGADQMVMLRDFLVDLSEGSIVGNYEAVPHHSHVRRLHVVDDDDDDEQTGLLA